MFEVQTVCSRKKLVGVPLPMPPILRPLNSVTEVVEAILSA